MPAALVHCTHGPQCGAAVILRSADSPYHCRRGLVRRLQGLLMLGEHLKHLDILCVVVDGGGLPLEQVVVFDDILMSLSGQRGQGQSAWA